MAELIIREKKKHFGIPRKILVNGKPLCTMKAQEIRLQLPPAQYCITIQSIVPSFCAVKYVSVSEETDNVLEFSDREKWWDIVFTVDIFLWLAKIFLDPDITLIGLSDLLSTNRTYLSKIINLNYDCTFSELINNMRIQYALSIIKERTAAGVSLKEVSAECGYANQASFIRNFAKLLGKTPGEWLAENNTEE